MKVKIKTCTPIWTGGIETGKCDRIHETSILGSLRWWMEVLVRGLGGQVCDPTQQKCSYDSKKFNKGICRVCEVFGATLWKRQFRLEVVEDNIKPDTEISSEIKLESYQYQYKNKTGETKTATGTPQWYFPKNSQDKPRCGEFTVKIQILNPNFKPEIIAGLIQFIADWSALGARPQMGFGVIQVMNENFSQSIHLDNQPLYDWLFTTTLNANDQQLKNYRHLPSLQNIFLVKIQSKSSNFNEKSTFSLKYDLRQLFRSDKHLRHFIMGTVKGDRIAAKIKVSRPYKDINGNTLMRVWGWVPENSEFYKNGWDREKIVATIYDYLNNKYKIQEWREMKSTRNLVIQNQEEPQAFLLSLLKFEGSDYAI